jgi:hypothetical protein
MQALVSTLTKRVHHPTDYSFALGYSPPHLLGDAVPLATEFATPFPDIDFLPH